MNPMVAQWADKIDETLQNTLYPQHRNTALEMTAKIINSEKWRVSQTEFLSQDQY
jgi:hypothetical protein